MQINKCLRNLSKTGVAVIVAASIYACSEQEEAMTPAAPGAAAEAAGKLLEGNELTEAAVFPDNKRFLSLDGSPVDLAGLEGRNILVNYWATWCAPCIREIPSLLSAADALGDDFVVMLASDETPEQISAFISENGFNEAPFVKLEGSFAGHGIQAVPSTSMFNTEGVQVGQWLGELEWDHEEVIAGLKTLAE